MLTHTYRGSVTQIYFMSNLDILYGLTVMTAVWFVRDKQINYREEFNVIYHMKIWNTVIIYSPSSHSQLIWLSSNSDYKWKCTVGCWRCFFPMQWKWQGCQTTKMNTKLHKIIIILIHMTCILHFKCSEAFIYILVWKKDNILHSCTNMNELWWWRLWVNLKFHLTWHMLLLFWQMLFVFGA